VIGEEIQVKSSSSGMTLIEVLVALIVLGVGIVALAGSSSMVTRMIGWGRVETQAALVAARRMEILRAAARSTTPPCSGAGFASGGPGQIGRITESWVVPPTGAIRRVTVTAGYLTVRGARSAVLETLIQC
jgi:prepilin-type N-terminal cleavage/methylation domain-containing protein